MWRKLSSAEHDWREEIFIDSSKELFSDKVYNADQIRMYIDPDVTEYKFKISLK